MWACDGVSVQCAVCSIHEKGKVCVTPLSSPQDRFCPEHWYKHHDCFVVACSQKSRAGRLACEAHEKVEARMAESRGRAYRELKRRYAKAGFVANPGLEEGGQGDDDHCVGSNQRAAAEAEEETEHEARAVERKCRKRKYTCCEQLVVRPCGIIPGRTTLFGAEGVKSVSVGANIQQSESQEH